MNPVEMQNAYFRSESAHTATQLAAVHNELAQRHLAQRLEQERHTQETQIKELSESSDSLAPKDATEEDAQHQNLPGRRYRLASINNARPGAIIVDGPDPGRRLDITI